MVWSPISLPGDMYSRAASAIVLGRVDLFPGNKGGTASSRPWFVRGSIRPTMPQPASEHPLRQCALKPTLLWQPT
jgi:hypothetical protein